METIPDTPSNAAIDLLTAMQTGDVDEIEMLICDRALTEQKVDLEDPSTLGALADVYETASRIGGIGGEGEYSAREEVDLQVDTAWTEVVFENEQVSETWRLHMMRENGKWRACGAELRSKE